ncbi:MAG: hypothetical protein HQ509_08720 [Candidatus Marinimicrobia bacterium]|nr:hypothetical protein [Candidatus Neomarinimicrobiota bacterium]
MDERLYPEMNSISPGPRAVECSDSDKLREIFPDGTAEENLFPPTEGGGGIQVEH